MKTGNSGMNLKAINYWFCAESGIYLENEAKNNNDFKFIIAEPLDENTGTSCLYNLITVYPGHKTSLIFEHSL